jgi:DNA anti-recombination protein RmuC
LFIYEELKRQTNILLEKELRNTTENEHVINKLGEELRRLNIEIDDLKSKLKISTPGPK